MKNNSNTAYGRAFTISTMLDWMLDNAENVIPWFMWWGWGYFHVGGGLIFFGYIQEQLSIFEIIKDPELVKII